MLIMLLMTLITFDDRKYCKFTAWQYNAISTKSLDGNYLPAAPQNMMMIIIVMTMMMTLIIIITIFATIISPIQHLCGLLCARKSSVYQTPLLNISADNILPGLNIPWDKILCSIDIFSDKSFHDNKAVMLVTMVQSTNGGGRVGH